MNDEFVEVVIERATLEMESKKTTFHLLALVFSLLMIEKSMAFRILATNYPPPSPDNDRSRMGANGSPPKQDGKWNGNSSDQGTLLVPPPSTKTTIAQAGQPNMSASAVVVAPTNAKVNVSTAVSPTSATAKVSAISSSNTSSTRVTNGGYVSESSFKKVSQSSSTTVTKYP